MVLTIKEFGTSMLVALPLAVAIRVVMIVYNRIKGRKITLMHEIGCVLFIMFLAGLYNLTIQSLATYNSANKVLSIQLGISGGINLIPLKTINMMLHNVDTYYGFSNLFGNIMMFVPVGLLLPLLWNFRRPFWQTLIYGAGISILIEVLQLPLQRGTDIDDVILNTLGTILGFMIYALIKTSAPRFAERFRN